MARPVEAVKSPAEAARAVSCMCRHWELRQNAPGGPLHLDL